MEFIEQFFDLCLSAFAPKWNLSSRCEVSHPVMFHTILLRHVCPIFDILLHGWIDNKLFSDGMASKFPCKLILVTGLGIIVLGIDDFVVVVLEFGMVMLDGFTDRSSMGAGHGVAADR